MPSSNINTIAETTGDWRSKSLPWSTMCGHFILENPEEGDVTFLVGEEQEEVKTFKFVLRVISPIFNRAFSTDWDHGNPISIPDIEPKAFRQFLKLIFNEEVDSSTTKSLDLPLDEIFNILYISQKYDVIKINKMILSILVEQICFKNALYIYANVINFDDDRIFFHFVTKNFEAIIKQDEFLQVPMDILAELLKLNELKVNEVNLFKALCRWGRFQFNQQNGKEEDEISGENLRKTLGPLLSLIRFPLFSARDFVNEVPKGLLSSDESLSTITFIALKVEGRKEMLLQNNCSFAVECREPIFTKTVSFDSDSRNALFVCEKYNKIDVDIVSENHALKIHSFGFHGPSDQDTSKYDISVICKIMEVEAEEIKKAYGKIILAQKNKIFCIKFDPPFFIKQNMHSSRNRFSISLEGASLPSSIMAEQEAKDGVKCFYNYGRPGPLAEIEYEVIERDESAPSPAI